MGHTCVFGSEPNSLGHPQKSFVVVDSSTWTSSPMTASYSGIAQDSPSMSTPPDPKQFTTERADVGNGVTVAYVREGAGGVPLLLVHGYPETKRICWRNIEALAASGFEVIAPDLRGFGDSDIPPDDDHDI